MATIDRQMSTSELALCADLEQRCIASIERTDWSGTPLTEQEKHLIGMVVTWTFYDLRVRARVSEQD